MYWKKYKAIAEAFGVDTTGMDVDACAPGNPKPATLEQFEEMFRKLM